MRIKKSKNKSILMTLNKDTDKFGIEEMKQIWKLMIP